MMWAQDDSGYAMTWEEALDFAEESNYAGYSDWRVPDVKELQSIADYSGVFPAIDSSIFNVSVITNEAGNVDYPYFWTGTSNPYIDPNDEYGYWYAWYVAFGYAVDTNGNDAHGAGAVRFDTKSEDGADGPDGERYHNCLRQSGFDALEFGRRKKDSDFNTLTSTKVAFYLADSAIAWVATHTRQRNLPIASVMHKF